MFRRISQGILKKKLSTKAPSQFLKGIVSNKSLTLQTGSNSKALYSDSQALYDYEEDKQSRRDGVVIGLIQKVLTERKHEDPEYVSEALRLLSATVDNEEDFKYLVNMAARTSALLQQKGFQDVGYMIKKPTVRVCVTGAAGQIAYSLLPRIASGEMLGKDQPVHLVLMDLPQSLNVAKGVGMELEDCSFPLLRGITVTSDLNTGFKDADYSLLVGAKPRGKGMERADLLKENGKIFVDVGKAMNANAKKSCLTVVVGNPANTNCLVVASNAPDIPSNQFSALTRLDHDRAISQIAKKANVTANDVEGVVVWGNHSPTMYPDVSKATINGKSVESVITDKKWLENEFVKSVQQRGTEVINARGLSSAASAADAVIKHMNDWVLGSDGEVVSMAVEANGSHGAKKGIYTSYPVTCEGNGKYTISKDWKLTGTAKTKVNASIKELQDEKKAVGNLAK